MLWSDNYYVICYSDKSDNFAHYRIDRMDYVEVEPLDAARSEQIDRFDLKQHRKEVFGMYVGDETVVDFECEKSLLNPVMDKFGENIKMNEVCDKIRFEASVQISPQFYAWCCSFGKQLKVIKPDSTVNGLRAYTKTLFDLYNESK